MYSSYLPNILINFIVKVAANSLIMEAHISRHPNSNYAPILCNIYSFFSVNQFFKKLTKHEVANNSFSSLCRLIFRPTKSTHNMLPLGILREYHSGIIHQYSESPIAVNVYKTLILSVIVKFMVPVLIFQTKSSILQAFFLSREPYSFWIQLYSCA